MVLPFCWSRILAMDGPRLQTSDLPRVARFVPAVLSTIKRESPSVHQRSLCYQERARESDGSPSIQRAREDSPARSYQRSCQHGNSHRPIEITGLEMKREGSMHLVPAPAVRLMKSRVTSRPGNKVYNLDKISAELSSRNQWLRGIYEGSQTSHGSTLGKRILRRSRLR